MEKNLSRTVFRARRSGTARITLHNRRLRKATPRDSALPVELA
jgi:hypothetical protein